MQPFGWSSSRECEAWTQKVESLVRQGLTEVWSQRERDRRKTISGANRLRMQKRQAGLMGLSWSEYLTWRAEKEEARAQREEDLYSRLEQRAKWDECREEREIEARRRHNRVMSDKYHADPDNWSTRRKRRRLFERDGWRCRVCGKNVTDRVRPGVSNRAVAGHIIAKAAGGDWTDQNMATLCHPCNVADGVNQIPIQTHLA